MATSYRTVHTLDAHHVSDLMELYRDEWWTNDRTADEVRTLLGFTTPDSGVVLMRRRVQK